MNYGKSAYTKVLELERKLGTNDTINTIKIYDGGTKETTSSAGIAEIISSNIKKQNNASVYFSVSFEILAENDDQINVSFYSENNVLTQKTYSVSAEKSNVYSFDLVYTPNADTFDAKLEAVSESGIDFKITEYKLIVLNAYGSLDAASEIELRVCKLSDNDFIISYTDDGYIYALATSKDSVNNGLEFSKILAAKSHSFALDKSNNLHLFYVTESGDLYDKTIGSNYNDVLVAHNSSVVYAVTLGKKQTGDIVIAFVDESRAEVKYITLSQNAYSESRNIPVKEGKTYVDLCMVASDTFVYCVVETSENVNYILKSAFEPLGEGFIEMLSAKAGILTTKYYTLGELTGDLVDELKVLITNSILSVINYEKLIDDEAISHLSCEMSSLLEAYQMPKDNYNYTVIIDKVTKDPEDRCSYADDALDCSPVQVVANETTGSKDVYQMNGWDEKWPFTEIRPCAFNNGVFLGYLDPNDFTKFLDGTDVDSYNNKYDVMVEFPKIYYCVETIDEKIYCRVSNKKLDDRYKCYAHVYDGVECDKIYLAAYICKPITVNTGGTTRYTLISASGQIADAYNYYDNTEFEKYLLDKAEGYRFMTFDQLIMIQCLYLLLFRSTDSQSNFAFGNTYGTEYAQGYCDKMGMYAGSLSTYTPCKLMGLENLYGTSYTYVSGIAIKGKNLESECYIMRRDPYSKVPYSKDGAGYVAHRFENLDELYITANIYLSDPIGTTEFGFIPQANKYNGAAGAIRRYFSDSAHFRSSYGYYSGGDYKIKNYGGIFCLFANLKFSMVKSLGQQGYRLVYYPQGGN